MLAGGGVHISKQTAVSIARSIAGTKQSSSNEFYKVHERCNGRTACSEHLQKHIRAHLKSELNVRATARAQHMNATQRAESLSDAV